MVPLFCRAKSVPRFRFGWCWTFRCTKILFRYIVWKNLRFALPWLPPCCCRNFASIYFHKVKFHSSIFSHRSENRCDLQSVTKKVIFPSISASHGESQCDLQSVTKKSIFSIHFWIASYRIANRNQLQLTFTLQCTKLIDNFGVNIFHWVKINEIGKRKLGLVNNFL